MVEGDDGGAERQQVAGQVGLLQLQAAIHHHQHRADEAEGPGQQMVQAMPRKRIGQRRARVGGHQASPSWRVRASQTQEKLSDDLQRLVASGRIEIGSHTLTHINMRTTPAADKRRELTESRRLLQAQTGQAVASFAYPFGIYGDEDVTLAREALAG
mgnify:CR=1 FL=1